MKLLESVISDAGNMWIRSEWETEKKEIIVSVEDDRPGPSAFVVREAWVLIGDQIREVVE